MHVSYENALTIMSHPKTIENWTGFIPRTNHAGHIIGTAQLLDDSGIFIPGITMEIELKSAIVTDQCLIQLSLRQSIAKHRKVVYQLEIAPNNKRSHNGVLPIFGPHEHIGDREPSAVMVPGVECQSWDISLKWFYERANITYYKIESPL